jgi:hypothetical protein
MRLYQVLMNYKYLTKIKGLNQFMLWFSYSDQTVFFTYIFRKYWLLSYTTQLDVPFSDVVMKYSLPVWGKGGISGKHFTLTGTSERSSLVYVVMLTFLVWLKHECYSVFDRNLIQNLREVLIMQICEHCVFVLIPYRE